MGGYRLLAMMTDDDTVSSSTFQASVASAGQHDDPTVYWAAATRDRPDFDRISRGRRQFLNGVVNGRASFRGVSSSTYSNIFSIYKLFYCIDCYSGTE